MTKPSRLPTETELAILREDFDQRFIAPYPGKSKKAGLKTIKAGAIIERIRTAFGHGKVFASGEYRVTKVLDDIYVEFSGFMTVYGVDGLVRFMVPLEGAWEVGYMGLVEAKKAAKTNAISKMAFEMWGVGKQLWLEEKDDDDNSDGLPERYRPQNIVKDPFSPGHQKPSEQTAAPETSGGPPARFRTGASAPHPTTQPIDRLDVVEPVQTPSEPPPVRQPALIIEEIREWTEKSLNNKKEARVYLDAFLCNNGLPAETTLRKLTDEQLIKFDGLYGGSSWRYKSNG